MCSWLSRCFKVYYNHIYKQDKLKREKEKAINATVAIDQFGSFARIGLYGFHFNCGPKLVRREFQKENLLPFRI